MNIEQYMLAQALLGSRGNGNTSLGTKAVGIAAIGDSITAYGAGERSDWLTRLCFFSGQGYRFRGQFAVGGATAEQVESIQLPMVLAMTPKPRSCVVAAGSNNYTDNTTVDSGLAAIRRMCDALEVAGILPILWTVPPRGDIAGSRPQINRWNDAIYKLRHERSLPLLDAHAALVDPATGNIVPRLTSDGTHPTDAGAATIAQWAMTDTQFVGVPEDGPPVLVSDDFDTTNLFAQGRGCFTMENPSYPGIGQNLYSYGVHGGSLVPGARRGQYQRWTRLAGAVANGGNVGIPDFPVTAGNTYEFLGEIWSKFDSTQVGMFNGLLALVWSRADDSQVKFEWMVGTPGLDEEQGVFLHRTVAPVDAVKVLPLIQQSSSATLPTIDTWAQMGRMSIRNLGA